MSHIDRTKLESAHDTMVELLVKNPYHPNYAVHAVENETTGEVFTVAVIRNDVMTAEQLVGHIHNEMGKEQ